MRLLILHIFFLIILKLEAIGDEVFDISNHIYLQVLKIMFDLSLSYNFSFKYVVSDFSILILF